MDIDIHLLVDFALGRLSPEESLAVLERVEHSPQLSETLELIIAILNAIHPEETSDGSSDRDGK